MAKFCKHCGKQLDGAACGCQNPVRASTPARLSPPEGFTHDPSSGLYYLLKRGSDENRQPGEWATWFYPDTGEYVQDFTPDAPTVAPQPVKPAAAKKLSPINIVIPAAGLILGVLVAFVQFGGF